MRSKYLHHDQPQYFPSPLAADAEGLLGVGGQLSPDWLMDAYAHGIFPWPVWDGTLAWWSPDPRAIFELQQFHVSRRLARRIRSQRFRVACDQNFAAVVQGCAGTGKRIEGTWITPELAAAYQRLHELGIAHSVETYREDRLAGGVFGIAVGGLFAGESMFHVETDASKVALAHLISHLHARGFTLFDIQQLTTHTASLGAKNISRRQYLQRLSRAVVLDVEFGSRLEGHPEAADDQK
jgi:leucyl/phenylalanyl-tRNA--protein transferase